MNRTATKLTKESRDGKPIYCVQWPRLPKGRNRQYFREKREAETFLKQKLAEQQNYGIEGMAFSLRQRAEYLECGDKLAPFNATLRDAVNFYLPHLQATNRSCTVKQLVDEIINGKKADGASHRYISDLKSRLNEFATAFDGKPVAEITTADIDRWLRGLSNSKTGKSVAPTTRNNFRRVLNVAFNFARDRGYCINNPVAKSAKAKVIESAAGILTRRNCLQWGTGKVCDLDGGRQTRRDNVARTAKIHRNAEMHSREPDSARRRKAYSSLYPALYRQSYHQL